MEHLLFDCRNLLKAISNKRIEHIYREANQCFDVLAKMELGANILLFLWNHRLWWKVYWAIGL